MKSISFALCDGGLGSRFRFSSCLPEPFEAPDNLGILLHGRQRGCSQPLHPDTGVPWHVERFTAIRDVANVSLVPYNRDVADECLQHSRRWSKRLGEKVRRSTISQHQRVASCFSFLSCTTCSTSMTTCSHLLKTTMQSSVGNSTSLLPTRSARSVTAYPDSDLVMHGERATRVVTSAVHTVFLLFLWLNGAHVILHQLVRSKKIWMSNSKWTCVAALCS